jgi:hypothetical protein
MEVTHQDEKVFHHLRFSVANLELGRRIKHRFMESCSLLGIVGGGGRG